MNWSELGIMPCELLIPSSEALFPKWACIACDQFTSQPEYWAEAERISQNVPSTLHMIVPECYLKEQETRIPEIHNQMNSYLGGGILSPCVSHGMVLTERTTQNGVRTGLVLAVDLDCYDYRKGTNSLIRATEMTIESRLPARVKVRRGASLETSHVLMLCDDPECKIIEPVWKIRDSLRKIYDFDLMLGGGHLRGWAVESERELQVIYDALHTKLLNGGEHPFLFAVGDGNHSLASAKAFWEETKKNLSEEKRRNHPARYAMVELENIHEPALCFEAIHRVVFNCNEEQLKCDFEEWLVNNGMRLTEMEGRDIQTVTLAFRDHEKTFSIQNSPYGISVATVQHFLDNWLTEHPECTLDYVHGANEVYRLCTNSHRVGFLLPKPEGSSLFEGVVRNGCLPRKTFSLGEACEKRYYMECRKIIND